MPINIYFKWNLINQYSMVVKGWLYFSRAKKSRDFIASEKRARENREYSVILHFFLWSSQRKKRARKSRENREFWLYSFCKKARVFRLRFSLLGRCVSRARFSRVFLESYFWKI